MLKHPRSAAALDIRHRFRLPPPRRSTPTSSPCWRASLPRPRVCHGEHPTHSVSLDLRPGHAYAALVSAPAKTRAGALRVVPRAPERSFLLAKLVGTQL